MRGEKLIHTYSPDFTAELDDLLALAERVSVDLRHRLMGAEHCAADEGVRLFYKLRDARTRIQTARQILKEGTR